MCLINQLLSIRLLLSGLRGSTDLPAAELGESINGVKSGGSQHPSNALAPQGQSRHRGQPGGAFLF